MTTQYARVVRWSLALTSVVAAVAVVLCAAFGGSKGAYGALIGVGVVTAFFAISIIVVGRAAADLTTATLRDRSHWRSAIIVL